MQNGRFSILLFLGVFALLLGGCGSTAAPEPQEAAEEAQETVEIAEEQLALAMTAWALESMGSPEDSLTVLEGTRPSLNFLVSRYAGSGGCNWYMGGYDLNGNEVSMASPNQTRVSCEEPEGVMSQDETFIGAVANTTSYALENDQLKLYTVGEQLLATLNPAESVPLEGNLWSLKFISDGVDMNPVLMGVEITALFEDGQISGSGGCNTYSGGYELDGQYLSVGPLAVTEMACDDPKDVMDQESAYTAALESVAGYELVGGVMALVDDSGTGLLQYGVK